MDRKRKQTNQENQSDHPSKRTRSQTLENLEEEENTPRTEIVSKPPRSKRSRTSSCSSSSSSTHHLLEKEKNSEATQLTSFDSLSMSQERSNQSFAEDGSSQNSTGQRGILFEELLPQTALTSSRLKLLVEGINSQDPDQMMACLTELCDTLSVGSEDSIGQSTLEVLTSSLTQVISNEYEPEIEILATRALSNMVYFFF
eukprot:c21643_g1_i2.p1 GENE.c21643_g1_i2~~c21643_g1_i2.p1  ORF type:complete len:200 (-),score=57.45 c21643_g1_i2:14-613(-)